MAPATTRFLRWCNNFGPLKMKKSEFSAWNLIFLLCFHRCCGNGDPIVDTKLTEESSLNFLFNCSINQGEELKTHINESAILCTSPSEHELVILCDDFLNISKDFCNTTNAKTLPKFHVTDIKSVCNPPVKIPPQLVSKFDKAGVIYTLSQEDQCAVRCLNAADTKVLSLCVLGRAYLDIYTELLLKPKTVTGSTTSTTTTTTTKSTSVSSVGTTKKSSTVTPTTTTKSPVSTPAVPSTKKLVQPNLESNYDDSDQLKYTLSLQENDFEQNKEDDPLLDDTDDAEKGEMEAPKPASNVEESAAAGDNGNIYGRKKGTYGDYYPEDGNSHFFVYFLTVIVLCILGYVLYHNKKKVIALIVEGRQDRRRRPNTNQYRKLDSNLEEVMHGYENGSDANANGSRRSNIIY